MWKKQIRAERAAEAASQMLAKANALKAAAMERPCSSGNEGGASEEVSGDEVDNKRNSITLTNPDLVTRALLRPSDNFPGTPGTTQSSLSGSNDDDSPRSESVADVDIEADAQVSSRPGNGPA